MRRRLDLAAGLMATPPVLFLDEPTTGLVPHGTSDAGRTCGRGDRALDSSRDLALREAALAVLAEVGYDGLTMDAVAARAGAAKTTIYRRWRDKADLVVDALDSLKGIPDVPGTGSLRHDLRALAESITSAESRFATHVTTGMVSALARDAGLRRVFGEQFLTPRMAGFRTLFERAVARGEMPGGRDLDLLARLFPALALQQLVMSGELPGTRFTAHLPASITSQPYHALALRKAQFTSPKSYFRVP